MEETCDIANDRRVGGFGAGANVAPPREHGTGPREELLEAGCARIGIDLVGGLRVDHVQHVLNGAHPSLIVDSRLHRFGIEQEGWIVGMFGVSRGA